MSDDASVLKQAQLAREDVAVVTAPTLSGQALYGALVTWFDRNEGTGVWLTTVATFLLVVGVVFAWFAFRDARTTRHAQLLADFSQRYDDKSMNQSAKLGREYGPAQLVELSNKLYGPDAEHPPPADKLDAWKANLDDWYVAIAWLNLLETIGVMVRANVLPAALVYQVGRPDNHGLATRLGSGDICASRPSQRSPHL